MRKTKGQGSPDASWEDALTRYGVEKRAPPVYSNNYPSHRLYRDGRYNRKDKEREYDVLTHKWRDEEKEKLMTQKELQRDLGAMETAKARVMRYESHYDVVTHQRKIDAPEEEPEPPPKPVYQPAPEPQAKVRDASNRGLSHYYWPNGDRDYHIINNRYLRDHDTKAKADHRRVMEDAGKRFAANNHYNIIQGRMYDPLEEHQFQQARSHAQSLHGTSQINKLPLSIKTREGAMYDITAPQNILNRDKLIEHERREAEKVLSQLKVEYEMERPIRSQKEQELKEQRCINRISHARYMATVQRGYNILNNQDFKGRTGQSYAPARTRPRGAHPLRLTASGAIGDSGSRPGSASKQHNALQTPSGGGVTDNGGWRDGLQVASPIRG